MKLACLFNKQNVFDDFAYAAKYPSSARHIGSPDSTAIQGGSNGGLVGCSYNACKIQILFKVAIPQVGVLGYAQIS
jgi:prolyl oligopeptidase